MCTRTDRSRANVHVEISSPAFLFCLIEEQIQYPRSQRRYLELVLPFSCSEKLQDCSSCLRNVSHATCSCGPRKGLTVAERERSTFLAVAEVSVEEQGLLLEASERGHGSLRDVPERGDLRLPCMASA